MAKIILLLFFVGAVVLNLSHAFTIEVQKLQEGKVNLHDQENLLSLDQNRNLDDDTYESSLPNLLHRETRNVKFGRFGNQKPPLYVKYGLAPLILNIAPNDQVPQRVPQNDVNEIDYETKYYNTPTGISLDPIPSNRIDIRPAPPIAHGSSSQYLPPNTRSRRAVHSYEIPSNSEEIRGFSFDSASRRSPLVHHKQFSSGQKPHQNMQQFISNSPNVASILSRNPQMCAFAVLQCCSDKNYNSKCFENRGCPGPFFDNPCDNELADAAAHYINSNSYPFRQ